MLYRSQDLWFYGFMRMYMFANSPLSQPYKRIRSLKGIKHNLVVILTKNSNL